MALPKSVRLEENLEPQVEKYLKKNRIKLAQLINMAVRKFISEPQAIELVPIEMADWKKTAKEAYEEHKDAMDKLK